MKQNMKISIGGNANIVKGEEMIITHTNIPHGLVVIIKSKILITMNK